MKPIFPKIAILGLGLIGGSLALDLKRLRLAKSVVGYNRSPTSRRIALKRRACDAVFADPAEAVRDADLVVLAVPVRSIPRLAKAICPHLKEGALVTDVGSTKESLHQKVRQALPRGTAWIGGHPIAGTENTGMASAETGLFKARWWILTPKGKGSGPATKKLSKLLRAIGAKVEVMSPVEHDRVFAAASHLPHLLAFSLVQLASQAKHRRALKFAGSSFRDATRVAASSPEMWVDICLDNRKAILATLRDYEKLLKRMRRNIEAGRESSLQLAFASTSQARRKM